MNITSENLILYSDVNERKDEFAEDVKNGLSAKNKFIPPKYFYDTAGSELFEKITASKDYYPTSTEEQILIKHSADIISSSSTCIIAELGSGSSLKTRHLLNSLAANKSNPEYLAVDVSPSLNEYLNGLLEDYPAINIKGYNCDYITGIKQMSNDASGNKLVLFLGSSIGNLTHSEAVKFLTELNNHMNAKDCLLIGFDMIKDEDTLNKAYNDSEGLTAKFNKNILARINKELGGNFDLDSFEHYAFYNREHSRIEMHLVSKKEQEVYIEKLNAKFSFKENETIHTENSYKYSDYSISNLADSTGWKINKRWTDDNFWFSEYLFSKK